MVRFATKRKANISIELQASKATNGFDLDPDLELWIFKVKCDLDLWPHTWLISCLIRSRNESVIYLVHRCPPTEKGTVVNTLFCVWLNIGVRPLITVVLSVQLRWTFWELLTKFPMLFLLRNLKHTVCPYACNLIISYLRNHNHRVKIMGRHSDWATINRRVPQGSVPFLYLLICL